MPASADKLNAAGLTPEQSKALGTRQPTSEEASVLEHIKELYLCAPTEASYSIYAPGAVFHDPIGHAEGVEVIKAQFNALPKLFKGKSTIDRFVVLEHPSTLPVKTILVDQDVTYCMQPDKPTKTVNSLLTLERDNNGKITKHSEEWDHRRETDSSDGFLGTINQARKTLTAKLTAAFVDSEAPKA